MATWSKPAAHENMNKSGKRRAVLPDVRTDVALLSGCGGYGHGFPGACCVPRARGRTAGTCLSGRYTASMVTAPTPCLIRSVIRGASGRTDAVV